MQGTLADDGKAGQGVKPHLRKGLPRTLLRTEVSFKRLGKKLADRQQNRKNIYQPWSPGPGKAKGHLQIQLRTPEDLCSRKKQIFNFSAHEALLLMPVAGTPERGVRRSTRVEIHEFSEWWSLLDTESPGEYYRKLS